MRVALTGATGFIGSHILAELHEHGHEVTALVRANAARARAELDWHPSHAGRVDELRNGSYRSGKEQTR